MPKSVTGDDWLFYWRSKPLVSNKAIEQLIGTTTRETGLKVKALLDTNAYPAGLNVADAELAAIAIAPRLPMVTGTTRDRGGKHAEESYQKLMPIPGTGIGPLFQQL